MYVSSLNQGLSLGQNAPYLVIWLLKFFLLQFDVRNVHVRYEDSTNRPGEPFAFGFTLSRLYAEVSDVDDKGAAAVLEFSAG